METRGLKYGVAYVIGIRQAGILKFLIVAGWFAVPALAQMIEHPTHAAGFFFYWLQSLPVPHYFTTAEVTRAELTAVVALTGVIFAHFVTTTLLYRRVKAFLPLWPLAFLFVGVVGNLGWWFGKGVWDNAGALAGIFPAVLAGIVSMMCEKWGADFVFGRGERPDIEEAVEYYE
jgi:hypothetical protein